MKNFLCLIGFLALMTSVPKVSGFNFKCLVSDWSAYYDITPFSNLGNSDSKNSFFKLAGGDNTHIFQICTEIKYEHCGEAAANARLMTTDCKALINSKDNPTITVEESGGSKHLLYVATEKKDNVEYKLQLTLNCDPNGSPSTAPKFTGKYENNALMAEVSHNLLCSYFDIASFYKQYDKLFGIGFIVLGLLCAFCGRKLLNVVLFLIGLVIIAGVVFMIFYQTWLIKRSENVKRNTIIALCIAGAAGLTAGILLAVFSSWCFIILGGILGGLGGSILFTATIAPVAPAWAIYVVIPVGAIICAILGYFFKNPVTIVSTSFAGSYLALSGVGFLAGGFPSIIDLYNQVKDNNFNFAWQTYVYIGGILLLTLVAIIVQCNYLKNDDDDDEDNDNMPLMGRTKDY